MRFYSASTVVWVERDIVVAKERRLDADSQVFASAVVHEGEDSLVACHRRSDSTKPGGAPGWQGGNRSNTSGIARSFNAASRDAPTGDCFRNFDYRPLLLADVQRVLWKTH